MLSFIIVSLKDKRLKSMALVCYTLFWLSGETGANPVRARRRKVCKSSINLTQISGIIPV